MTRIPGFATFLTLTCTLAIAAPPAPAVVAGTHPCAATANGDSKPEADPGSIPVTALARRRAALLDLLEKPGIAVVRSADEREAREHPQDSDFRQDNDFFYLTGLETPGSWLLLIKPQEGEASSALYVPGPSAGRQLWMGPQPTPTQAGERAGIAAAWPVERFADDLIALLERTDTKGGGGSLYLPLGQHADVSELAAMAGEAGLRVADLTGNLARLRLVKDAVELARLRCAIAITVQAQRAAMRAARPGMYEYELEAIIEYVFRSRGAQRVGFPSIVGSGPNSVVLHYDDNRRLMQPGDLTVMDIGAEYGYYTADVTRTIPVSGKFTDRQRAIYEVVLSTQLAVIDSVRPGTTIFQLEKIARRHMRQRSDTLCGKVTCDRYFLHAVSHWLGMDVHDVGSYMTPLAPGMVLTVEPGIYLPDEGLGVRIEDDVLVTESGHEVLSTGAPKTVKQIESLMSSQASEVIDTDSIGEAYQGSRNRN